MRSTSDCSSGATASASSLGACAGDSNSQSIKTPASLRKMLRYSVGFFVGLTDRLRVCSFRSLRASERRYSIAGVCACGAAVESLHSCRVGRGSSSPPALAPGGTARNQPITAAHFAVVAAVRGGGSERGRGRGRFRGTSHAAGSLSERTRFIEGEDGEASGWCGQVRGGRGLRAVVKGPSSPWHHRHRQCRWGACLNKRPWRGKERPGEGCTGAKRWRS
jgi:hypothetical protein